MKKRYRFFGSLAGAIVLIANCVTGALVAADEATDGTEVVDISSEVAIASEAEVAYDAKYDANSDGKISISDAIVLARAIAEAPTLDVDFHRIDLNSDGYIDAKDLCILLIYLNEGEKNPNPGTTTDTTTTTTVTTTSETTLTTTTAFTTTMEPTTTATTVTTTFEPTTTTTTVTTSVAPTTTSVTSTTLKLTTTSTTTSTSTTTTEPITEPTIVTTTTAENQDAQMINYLNKNVLPQISVDTEIPAYNGDLYEAKECVFVFKVENTKYAYTLLSDAENKYSVAEMLMNGWRIAGIHVWEYTGSAEPISVDEYDMYSRAKSHYTYHSSDGGIKGGAFINPVLDILQGGYYSSDDINGDKVINEIDIQDYLKLCSSDIYEFVFHEHLLSEEATMRYINDLSMLGISNTEIIMKKDSLPEMYAFNIQCGDLRDDYEGNAWGCCAQLLPAEFYDKMIELGIEEDEEGSDDTMDYIAYYRVAEYEINGTELVTIMHTYWSKVANKSDNWWFISGAYAYVLDSDGNRILDMYSLSD